MKEELNLSKGNFKWAGEELRCEPEMVMAVSFVECKRKPFDTDGFPAILYERHVFYRNAVKHHGVGVARKWMQSYSRLCNINPTPAGGYGTFRDQRVFFNEAWKLCSDCAMEACSWGPFQELGENWESLGFKSVGQLVDTMKSGVEAALYVFVKSIKMRGLQDDMQMHRYETIALLYNGKGYSKFNYHTQIKNAYESAKKLNINWSSIRPEMKLPEIKKPPLTMTIEEETHPDLSLSSTEVDSLIDNLSPDANPPLPVIPPPQENVTIQAPPPSSFGSKMVAWLAGLGITLPSFGAVYQGASNFISSGNIDTQTAFSFAKDVFQFILPYMVYLVIIFAVFWGLKELMKYITLLLQVWMAGKQNMNNVIIQPRHALPSRPLTSYIPGAWRRTPEPEMKHMSLFDDLGAK